MKRTAHSIARTGMARMHGEHLVAANQACSSCTNTCSEGKYCHSSSTASLRTLKTFVRIFGPHLAAIAAAFLMAAAPALLDGEQLPVTSRSAK